MNHPLIPRGYRIAPHYRNLTVWTFGPKSFALVGTSKHTPLPGQNRRMRYNIIAQKLQEYRLSVPKYQSKGWGPSDIFSRKTEA